MLFRSDADDFWRLYRRILARKVSDAVDRQKAIKRGGGGTTRHTEKPDIAGTRAPGTAVAVPTDDLDLLQSGLPSPEVEAIAKETTASLIGLLRPDLQKVARMRIDGRTIPDIAAELGVSARSVDRMLETIRSTWVSSGLVERTLRTPGAPK